MKVRQRRKPLESAEWAAATMIGRSMMWATADELNEIRVELLEVLRRYKERSDDAGRRPEGGCEARVFVVTSVRPQL